MNGDVFMNNNYSGWFIFYCVCALALILPYSYLANELNWWIITPPFYILFGLCIMVYVGLVRTYQQDTGSWKRTRKVISRVFLWLMMIAFGLLTMLSVFTSLLGFEEHLITTTSPNETYTIDFYTWDAGAAGTFGIRGELNGPLWFTKNLYYKVREDTVEIEWIDEHQVKINKRLLNLKMNETVGY
jgi:hypothetical protein